MNGFMRPAAKVLARSFRTSAVGCCLLFAGAQAIAAEATSLDLTVTDVFPVTRADLGFADDPDRDDGGDGPWAVESGYTGQPPLGG